MNLTSNQRLLELLLGTIQTTLLPELQSSNAKAMAGVVQAVLTDLLKRERRTPERLARCIADGRTLATDLLAPLRRAGVDPAPLADTITASMPSQVLSHQLQIHAALTQTLATLTQQLVSARGSESLAGEHAAISELLLRAARWELGYNLQQEQPLDAPAPRAAAHRGPLTAETLTAFVRSRHSDGDAATVLGFEAIPGGFGKQTSRFSLRAADGSEQALIVRKSDPQPMLSHAGFIIENEFHLLKTLSASGYLAPSPLWLGTDVAGVDASFYVMNCMPGRIQGSFLGGLERGDPQAMLLDVATQLARLHTIPLHAFAEYCRQHDDAAVLTDTVESCYRRQLAQWRRYAAEVEQLNSPFLQYLLDWLERNIPADQRPPVLVHGDFNIHNLLIENDRVSGVLDWECAMFGAPEQDLAYIQPHISQHIDWKSFLAQYRSSGGRALDDAAMPYYLAFSALRLHIAMLRATRNLQSGANDDIRYAMVELAFGARFMELGLAGTLPAPQVSNA